MAEKIMKTIRISRRSFFVFDFITLVINESTPLAIPVIYKQKLYTLEFQYMIFIILYVVVELCVRFDSG
jgi:hypothetical protein